MIPTLEELRHAPSPTLDVPPSTEAPPSRLAIPIPTTRHVIEHGALPFTAPPYTSVLDDVFMQNTLFNYTNEIRQDALFPVRLKAGQQMAPNGGAGLYSTPREDNLSMLGAALGHHPIPETRSGLIMAASI